MGRLIAKSLILAGCAATLFVAATLPPPQNPIIRDQFVADPSAHVFNGRLYLYLTNDSGNDGTYWNGKDWRAFSTADMRVWRDHGSIANVGNFGWAKELAWAPGAVSLDGAYYLIVPVERTKIGVLRSKSPTGPFVDHIGAPLVDKARDTNTGAEPIDPAVFVNDDGKIYMAFGTRTPKIVELTRDMKRMAAPIRDLKIAGAPPGAPYGEAPWLHKRHGIYYLSYSTGWPGQIVYATSRNPAGPYIWKGVILDRMNTITNHHAIVAFKGGWHLFYHNKGLPGGSDQKRSTNMDRLYYDKKGSILQVVPTGAGALPGLKAVANPAK